MTAFSALPAAVAAHRVWMGSGFEPATVRIDRGVIAAVDVFDARADLVLDDDRMLLPGLVDSHVHLDEPGRTEWEGFATGTAAAAAGGVTTVLDMPLNSVPVTTTVEALDAAGVVGFKCFLSPSGIDEFGHLDPEQLEVALGEIARLGSILVVHAEDPRHLHPGGPLGDRYADFVASRPPSSEREAIRAVIEASRRTSGRAHIVHVSDGGALDDVRAAKAGGVPLTIETCPHYLTLRAEDVPAGAAEFKCCPPIRDAANQDRLWQGVLDGTIDAIVSDHSPSTPDLKASPDFGLSWGGISGLQTGFTAVWTEAHRRGVPLDRLLPLFTTGPARIGGLGGRGRIAAGEPAHLVAFDPDAAHVIDAANLEYRNKLSPWHGQSLRGAVEATYVHGALAFTPAGGVAERHGREILAESATEA